MLDTTSLTIGDAPRRIAEGSRRPASLGEVPDGAVSLAMGEPFSGTSEHVIEAAIRSLRAGRTKYAPLVGAPELRNAIAARLGSKHRRTITPQQVVPTHGASGGLAATVLALVRPGDRVVIPEPTYSLYADHVALAGGVVEWVPNHTDGSLDLENLSSAIVGARMMILCNPGNPSGAVIDRRQLAEVAALLEPTECFLVSDEAYADIVFDDIDYLSSLDLSTIEDRVVCCGTFSKSYAMTGWRIGYVVAERSIADAIGLVHRTLNGAINTVVQDAAVAALDTPDAELATLRDEYQRRRDLVVKMLGDVPGLSMTTPQGAFYAFPRVSTTLTSDELTQRFADAGVLVRSGREYGPSGEGQFRISFATDIDTLTEGLIRIRRTLKEVITHDHS